MGAATGLVIAGSGSVHTKAQNNCPQSRPPNRRGARETRPSDGTLACADGGDAISRLHWTGWGSSFAAGEGVLAANECKPNCAEGINKFYTVLLTVSGRQQCMPGGQTAYTTVRYWF